MESDKAPTSSVAPGSVAPEPTTAGGAAAVPVVVQAQTSVCRFYKISMCKFGDNCRYRHEGPVQQLTPLQQAQFAEQQQLFSQPFTPAQYDPALAAAIETGNWSHFQAQGTGGNGQAAQRGAQRNGRGGGTAHKQGSSHQQTQQQSGDATQQSGQRGRNQRGGASGHNARGGAANARSGHQNQQHAGYNAWGRGNRQDLPDLGKRSAGALLLGSEQAIAKLSAKINSRLAASRVQASETVFPVLKQKVLDRPEIKDIVAALPERLAAKNNKQLKKIGEDIVDKLAADQQELLHKVEHIFTLAVPLANRLSDVQQGLQSGEVYKVQRTQLFDDVQKAFEKTPFSAAIVKPDATDISINVNKLFAEVIKNVGKRKVENVNKLHYVVGIEPLSIHAALSGYLSTNLGSMCLFHGSNTKSQQHAVMENPAYWDTHWLACARAELAEEANLTTAEVARLLDVKYQEEARQAMGLTADDLPTELKIFGGHSYVALVLIKDTDELLSE